MTASPTHVPRLPSLTGLRAIAAFLVLANHGVYLFVFADPDVQSGYQFVGDYLGPLGVGFFFVLSGFVLTWSAGASVSPRRFWRGRLVKIFPNHLVVFAASLALLFAAAAPVKADVATANLFLVQGFMPHPDYTMFPINGVTWSLSSELLFYALFPLLIPLIRRIRPELLWLWTGGAVAFALLLPTIARLMPDTPENPLVPGTSYPEMWFLYLFPGARLVEFLIGMLVARLVLTGRWIRLGVAPAALIVVAAYAASLWAPTEYRHAAVYVVPVALLIGAAATSDRDGRPSVLRSRPMIFLGEISFALFVVHLIAMQNLRGLSAGVWAGYGVMPPLEGYSTPVGILFLLGAALFCVVLAWLLHRCVEMPAMRRWARGRGARTPERAPVDVTEPAPPRPSEPAGQA